MYCNAFLNASNVFFNFTFSPIALLKDIGLCLRIGLFLPLIGSINTFIFYILSAELSRLISSLLMFYVKGICGTPVLCFIF